MKKHKLLLTLGTVAAVAAPIAAVVSCGSGSAKAKTKEETKPGTAGTVVAGATGTQAGSQTGTGGTQADATSEIKIEDAVAKNGYAASEVTDYMYNALVNNNQSNPWNGTWDVYKVTLPGTSHSINFSVDRNAKLSSEKVKEVITRFAKSTNYGFGILTLENIFITPKAMGSSGWGGAAKDILVQSGEIKGNDQNDDFVYQNLFNLVQHEYGHHETSALIDNSGTTQINNLVAKNVIGTQMHMNAYNEAEAERLAKSKELLTARGADFSTKSNAEIIEMAKQDLINAHWAPVVPNEQLRLVNAMNGRSLEDVLGKAYGAKDSYGLNSAVAIDPASHKSFMMDAEYHLLGLEWLNRPMNIIELMPWNTNNKATLYNFADAIKYQVGESKTMFDDNGKYTQAAHDLVSLYGKYVYGYDGFGVQVTPWEVKGFSSEQVDFVKVVDTNGKETVANVSRITSHYITKDNLFEDAKVINSSTAIYASINPMVPGVEAFPAKSVTFFKDADHDGHLDVTKDTPVTISYK